MATAAINELVVMREYLIASGVKNNEVSGSTVPDKVAAANVCIDELNNDIDARAAAAIVISRVGGDMNGDANHQAFNPILEIRCFGGTPEPDECHVLAQAVRDRLEGATNEVLSSGRIVSCVEVLGPQIVRDPVSEEYFAFPRYQCHMMA